MGLERELDDSVVGVSGSLLDLRRADNFRDGEAGLDIGTANSLIGVASEKWDGFLSSRVSDGSKVHGENGSSRRGAWLAEVLWI